MKTLEQRLDFARYMLHNESGFNFPNRSLASVKAKFYKVAKNKLTALSKGHKN